MSCKRIHRPALAVFLALAAAFGGASASADIGFNAQGRVYSLPITSYRDLPFRTVVRQHYDYSCGSAAVATVLRHHFDRPVGEAEVFRAMYENGDREKIRKVGFSMLDLKRYFEAQGFTAEGFRITSEQLMRSRAPVITVIQVGNYRHFVVVKGARDGKILVGDPATGLRKYARGDFEKVWNGVVLAVRGAQPALYDRDDEWASWARPPYDLGLGGESIAAFTRELPPLYQITPALPPTVSPR